METVNTIANAATKAIWGEPSNESNGQEPISGETGDVSAGEPYDKGNETLAEEPRSGEKGDVSAGEPYDMGNEDENQTSKANSANPVESSSTARASGSLATSDVSPISSNDGTDVGSTSYVAGGSNTFQNSQDQQGAERSRENPTAVSTGDVAGDDFKRNLYNTTEDTPVKSGNIETTSKNLELSSGTDARKEESYVLPEALPTSNTTGLGADEPRDANDAGRSSGGKLSHLKEKIKAKLQKNKNSDES